MVAEIAFTYLEYKIGEIYHREWIRERMSTRLDTVTILLSRQTVELPWASGLALLDKIASVEHP